MASKYEKFVLKEYNKVGGGLKIECIFCGKVWYPSLRPGGRLSKGAFVCPNSCTGDYEQAVKRLEKVIFTKNPATRKFEPARTVVDKS
jgi:hypothetical protein